MKLYLANRFREVMLSGTWIANTNWKKELNDVNFEQTISKFQNLNRIYDLSYHILYYIKGINFFFDTGTLEIKDSLSFPSIDIQSENEWQNLKDELFLQSELFAKSIELLDPGILNTTFYDKKYGTYIRNIDAMIEHAYYHLGQIVLLKKMK